MAGQGMIFGGLGGYDWQGAMGGFGMPAADPLTLMSETSFAPANIPGQGLTTLMPPGGYDLSRAGGGFLGDLSGMDKIRAGLGTVQTLAGLWSAWQANKLAKKSFKTQTAFANRNLENQTKTYNTAMDDRVANRQAVYAGSANAMTPAMAQAYLEKNRLSTARVG